MKAKILVVDDNDDTRTALASLLKAAGYRVVCAANGREALEYLRASAPPGAILLDLNMPVMSGLEFRQEQRKDPALADIPVFLVSGEAGLEKTVEALDAVGHIPKPIEVGYLFKSIHSLNKRTQAN
jgi:CheY-like chemotaxis protein